MTRRDSGKQRGKLHKSQSSGWRKDYYLQCHKSGKSGRSGKVKWVGSDGILHRTSGQTTGGRWLIVQNIGHWRLAWPPNPRYVDTGALRVFITLRHKLRFSLRFSWMHVVAIRDDKASHNSASVLAVISGWPRHPHIVNEQDNAELKHSRIFQRRTLVKEPLSHEHIDCISSSNCDLDDCLKP